MAWFNVIAGLCLYAILFACAPLIASFFNQPLLTDVSRLAFLCIPISAVGIVPNAKLWIELRQREQAIASITALTLSGCCGVWLAWNGFGYWSLAWQQVIYISVSNIIKYYFTRWKPTLPVDFSPIRSMFRFSSKMLVTNILTVVSQNVLTFIFGKLLPISTVGLFNQANKWNMMGASFVSSTMAQVAQPVLSSINDEGDEVIVPKSTTQLQLDDRLMVVTKKEDASMLEILIGLHVEEPEDWNSEKVDWNALDNKMESRVVVLTKPILNGRRLGSLKIRHTYRVNISRITRGDIKLLATPDLRLQYGDRLHIVGDPKSVDAVEAFFGNSVQSLNEPNLAAIFIGIILGLALGSLPLQLPGMSIPVRLGIAGGPIVVGIIVGAFGPRFHLITYTTRSASLMLRKLGLSLYLASLGLDSGAQFFETVIRPEGILWICIGFALTVVPVLLVGMALFISS